MVKYNTILKIIEQETYKTHDGTSLGKIKQSLNQWAEQHRTQKYEEIALYDNNGKLIHTTTDEDRNFCEIKKEDFDKIFNQDKNKLLHLTHNHPNLYIDDIPTYFSITDKNLFLYVKNADGEPCFRSISAETKNGWRTTFIKNNKFNEDNEISFSFAFDKYNQSCKDYYEKYSKLKMKYGKEHFKESKEKGLTGKQFEKEAIEHTTKKLGTLQEYLEKEGVFKDFEECNCKLRFARSKTI